VIGGGLTGMAVATRLCARGRRVAVFESHRTLGGCSSYFRRSGFSFDVGCTTLVDYRPGGVGGRLLEEIGVPDSALEHLTGYLAWLPGLTIALHADQTLWRAERARALGDTPAHRKLWALLDTLFETFLRASQRGARMPIRTLADLRAAAGALPLRQWPMLRYLNWTLDDAVRWAGLQDDARLRGFLGMVVQDTVHSTIDVAPLINSSLGLAIRANIARPRGGMYGFWNAFETRAAALGVVIHRATRVASIAHASRNQPGRFRIRTDRGEFSTDQIICTLPIWDAARIGPSAVGAALKRWCDRDQTALGGAAIVTMGVPEEEVQGQALTHHQFLPRPGAALGDGNNCFLSISSAGDLESAPAGWRAVMLSTHVELDGWLEASPEEHAARKAALGDELLRIARVAYPALGEQAKWLAVASPRTYAKFTQRHRGSVGGTRLTLRNSNQRSVPHDIGVDGWIQGGDTTWPGLGTAACAISSDIIATKACASE